MTSKKTVSQFAEDEDSRTNPTYSGTKRQAAASLDDADESSDINSTQTGRKCPRKDASERPGISSAKADRKCPSEDTIEGPDAVGKCCKENRRASSGDNSSETATKHPQENKTGRPDVHFPRAGGKHPIDDVCKRAAANSPTVERINRPEVIILDDDDKPDKEPAACGNRRQATDAAAFDLDGGQQDASFPERPNERISSPAADAGDRLSLCKVRDIFYSYRMCRSRHPNPKVSTTPLCCGLLINFTDVEPAYWGQSIFRN